MALHGSMEVVIDTDSSKVVTVDVDEVRLWFVEACHHDPAAVDNFKVILSNPINLLLAKMKIGETQNILKS